MPVPLAMTPAEREAFLAEPHVAVISVARPDRPPLTLPVWYLYEPGGDVVFATGARSPKIACIRAAGALSLCAQTETPPYRYVTVEGPAAIVPIAPDDPILRRLAHRYLGPSLGDAYLALTAPDRAATGEVLVRLTPRRWQSVDYGKLVAAAAGG